MRAVSKDMVGLVDNAFLQKQAEKIKADENKKKIRIGDIADEKISTTGDKEDENKISIADVADNNGRYRKPP